MRVILRVHSRLSLWQNLQPLNLWLTASPSCGSLNSHLRSFFVERSWRACHYLIRLLETHLQTSHGGTLLLRFKGASGIFFSSEALFLVLPVVLSVGLLASPEIGSVQSSMFRPQCRLNTRLVGWPFAGGASRRMDEKL